jgi:hypothetical protein
MQDLGDAIKKFRLYIVAFFITLLVSYKTLVVADIAIVVNANNGVDELSMGDIEKIFRAEKQFWDNGKKIRLIMRPMDSIEGKVLLEKIYNLPQEEFKLFWLEKVYKNIVAEPPTIIRSASMVNILVGQLQAAIAPIEVSKISEWAKIKVVKINGKMPGESGYPLKAEK